MSPPLSRRLIMLLVKSFTMSLSGRLHRGRVRYSMTATPYWAAESSALCIRAENLLVFLIYKKARGSDMQGIIVSINVSDKKGERKKPVDEVTIGENFGIEGDAHAS